MQRAELIKETHFAFYVLKDTNSIYKIGLKCYNNNYNSLKFLYKEMPYANNGILLNALKFLSFQNATIIIVIIKFFF